MERRLVLAVFLMALAIMVTQILFPPPEPPPAEEEEVPAEVHRPAPDAPDPVAPMVADPIDPDLPADTIWVVSDRFRYGFSTRGGGLVQAEILRHRSFVDEGRPVQLVPEEAGGFFTHRLVVGRDTFDLREMSFEADAPGLDLRGADAPEALRLRSVGEGVGLELVYEFEPDEYGVQVRGQVRGLGEVGSVLLTDLGPGLETHDDPTAQGAWFTRGGGMALVTRGLGGGVVTAEFADIGPRHIVNGPLSWVAVRDRYFLSALLADPGQPVGGVVARELPAEPLIVEGVDPADPPVMLRAEVFSTMPVGPGGEFSFRAYVGPQEHSRLVAMGSDLQQVNRFGYRWLQPVIRPIASVILSLLDFLHDTLGVAYGWVLILFGVLMRVVLWPLNAKAMRAQLRNMAVQPLITELRDKYKDDPQRQQQEMMKLYKEHGFNPLAGCLPMLVPFPVLITLFFVFEGTIAFRGEPFLWLPDLSLRDPLFILPAFLVVSMFTLQLVMQKMSKMEVNPQLKFMMYGMPLMVGGFFFFLPSGLNLYYATTNVATIPQQVLIAKERRKAQEELEREKAAEKREKGDDKPEKVKAKAKAGAGNRAARRRARRKG